MNPEDVRSVSRTPETKQDEGVAQSNDADHPLPRPVLAVSSDSAKTARELLRPDRFKGCDINANMLQASLGEYNAQLVYHLINPIYLFFVSMYQESYFDAYKLEGVNAHTGQHRDLRVFQEHLRDIPKYDDDRVRAAVEAVTQRISKRFRFSKVLKIIFVAKSMILASVRPNTTLDKDVKVAVPTVLGYTHKVMSLLARKLFEFPSLMRKSVDETEQEAANKSHQITVIITEAINGAVTDMLPHDEIMDAYLNDTLQADNFDASNEQAGGGQIANASVFDAHGNEETDDDESDEGDESETDDGESGETGSDDSSSSFSGSDDEQDADNSKAVSFRHPVVEKDVKGILKNQRVSRRRGPRV
jgi:hypothetical protein